MARLRRSAFDGQAKRKIACGGRFERNARASGFEFIAGVDEAGAGSWFGPVFAGAAILSPDDPIRGLRDSKLLTPERREVLAVRIRERAVAWAVGAADAYEIDRINIHQARKLAMRRAVEQLPRYDYLLIDALRIDLPCPQEAIIRGDLQCQSIAAASILAKTERDAVMRRWHEVYPEYGFVHNKGYGTEEHQQALRRLGPTSLHRYSYEPVRLACQYELWTGYEPAVI